MDGPDGWNDEVGYGAGEIGTPAFVVVTSAAPSSVRLTDLDWRFVTTGIQDAVAAGRSAVAGTDLDVVIMGGGATIASALDAGLVDVLLLHLAPVVLGGGTPLLAGLGARSLVQRDVRPTTNATVTGLDSALPFAAA